MKALVGTFNQEKAIVGGAFIMIIQLQSSRMLVSSSNLGAETVEHEVGEEDEEALGPGVGPGAGWAEHQPARVHRGRGCGDLAQVSVDTAPAPGYAVL